MPLPSPSHPPRMIEVAGPPGAGKSTLAAQMSVWPTVHIPERPSRRVALRALARGAMGPWSGLGRVTIDRTVIRSLAFLDHWERLARTSGEQPLHLVIDQGPLYRAIFVADRLGFAEPPAPLSSWWSAQLKTWGELLHLVIYLDAPDEVLLERIGGRAKAHRLKRTGLAEARAELRKLRSRYEQALDAVGSGRTEVLRIDTSKTGSRALQDLVAPGLSIG